MALLLFTPYKVGCTTTSLFHTVQKIITRQLSQFFLVPFIHQSIPAALRPLWVTAGHLLALLVPGVGHLQILHCLGAGHFPTPGLFPNFWHARGFLSEYNYPEDFAGKNKHISSSIKDRKKLKRVIKACSRFYACISCCLSSQNYEAKSGAIDVIQRFLVKLNQISVDIIWRTSLHILFDITYNFIALY